MSRRNQGKPFGTDIGLIHKMVVAGRDIDADEDFYTVLADNKKFFADLVPLALHFDVLCRIEKLPSFANDDEPALQELLDVEKDEDFLGCRKDRTQNLREGGLESLFQIDSNLLDRDCFQRLIQKLQSRWSFVACGMTLCPCEELLVLGYVRALEKVGLRPQELLEFFTYYSVAPGGPQPLGIRSFRIGGLRAQFRQAIRSALKRRKILRILETLSEDAETNTATA